MQKTEPDQLLIKMPSLRAVKSFVAAAKCQSFTRAADSLCVTPAAISRQVKELEDFLGAELFVRSGRAVALTTAGTMFFNVAQLSFMNIAQAADRLRSQQFQRQTLTICCSPGTANLWLAPRLPDFSSRYPDIELSIVATHDFQHMETDVKPDVFITQSARIREGYVNTQLFGELIYPVCSPGYLCNVPQGMTLEGLRDMALLNLSPYGRATLAEYVDWRIWFALQGVELGERSSAAPGIIHVNDYAILIQMALRDQGVVLGWHHLVEELISQGKLIRLVGFEVTQPQTHHYLAVRDDIDELPAVSGFRDWVLTQI
ncbi:LysR family transcriptional regulator [Pseudomonas sp. 3A(2025)]